MNYKYRIIMIIIKDIFNNQNRIHKDAYMEVKKNYSIIIMKIIIIRINKYYKQIMIVI